jgi:uncharacterized protein
LMAIFALSFLMAAVQGLDSDNATPSLGYPSEGTALLQLPDIRQGTEYTCGVGAMQAVLLYWGRDVGEEDLGDLLNTNPDTGTYPEDMVRAAKVMGLKAYFRDNLTLEDLESSLNQSVPVIVNCQSWRSPATIGTYADDWWDGHYLVVIGMDEENVYLEDPYILGSRGYLSRQEFVERWHNLRGWSPDDSVCQIHLGIFIVGERPADLEPFKHVD